MHTVRGVGQEVGCFVPVATAARDLKWDGSSAGLACLCPGVAAQVPCLSHNIWARGCIDTSDIAMELLSGWWLLVLLMSDHGAGGRGPHLPGLVEFQISCLLPAANWGILDRQLSRSTATTGGLHDPLHPALPSSCPPHSCPTIPSPLPTAPFPLVPHCSVSLSSHLCFCSHFHPSPLNSYALSLLLISLFPGQGILAITLVRARRLGGWQGEADPYVTLSLMDTAGAQSVT